MSPNNTLWNNGPGPFSRLHLHDGTTTVLDAPFRPWMQNGVTFTTHGNQMFVGHKAEGSSGQSAAVVQWGGDLLKFLSTSSYTAAGSGLGSTDGLELGRFETAGWFGLGDWQGASLQPNERLDLLDRTIRLRDFMSSSSTSWENNSATRVLVADDSDGRVYWRDVNTVDCKWELTTNNDVVTAWDPGATAGCPDDESMVGVGTDAPQAKLHVEAIASGGTDQGIYAHVGVGTGISVGVDVLTDGNQATENYGVRALATNASINTGTFVEADGGNAARGAIIDARSATVNIGVITAGRGGGNYGTGVQAFGGDGAISNHGVDAFADGDGAVVNYGVVAGATGNGSTMNYGVRADASGSATTNYGIKASASGGTTNYGVWGDAPNGAPDYAGYFNGDVHVTGTLTVSDANLKPNRSPVSLGDELDVVRNMQLYRYEFDTTVCPGMALPLGERMGLISQELEQVLPNLVRQSVFPAKVDSLGQVLQPAFEFKSVDYTGLIPYLILSIQKQEAEARERVDENNELQETIDGLQGQLNEQEDRLRRLEEALALCCARNTDDTRDQNTGLNDLGGADTERLLSIQPNPFTDHTTVRFQLERGGRAQLAVYGGDGRQLEMLQEAELPEGEHRYEWNTGHLAPGIYYVTLLLDGEPLVKRAVKVDR